MRLLVTGAAGHVAREVVRQALAAGDRVVAPYREAPGEDDIPEAAGLTWVRCDLADPAAVARLADDRAVDACIHAAAISNEAYARPQPLAAIHSNIGATANLLDAARRHRWRRFILISTGSVFQQLSDATRPILEDALPTPVDIYATTKHCAEQLTRMYRTLFELEAAAVRISWVYGPPVVSDSPTRGPIPMFLRRALAGLPLRAPSGADAAASYTYVGDVAAGLLAACRAPALSHAVYHLGCGVNFTAGDGGGCGQGGRAGRRDRARPGQRALVDLHRATRPARRVPLRRRHRLRPGAVGAGGGGQGLRRLDARPSRELSGAAAVQRPPADAASSRSPGAVVTLALIGAGNIGGVHAANIAAHPRARLGWVYDARHEAAAALAGKHGARAARSLDEALGEGVDAAVIASSTASHGEVAEACIAAGKAFLCEKPLAKDLGAARRIVGAARTAGLITAIGFNRRLDRGYAAIRQAVASGEIGRLEAILITSRSATPPSVQSVQATGGLLGEKGSHFYDLACWIAGEYPLELHAMGAALVDPAFAEVGEVDVAMITLAMPSGALCQLDFSWRAAYGQDERLEAVGALGMLQTSQAPDAPFSRYGSAGLTQAAPLPGWLARFAPTYAEELERFVRALETGQTPELASLEDGLAAQRLAEAAARSIREGRRIRLDA